jgi:hypothetical protein
VVAGRNPDAQNDPMCHFITLIAPTDDQPALAALMKRHGRAAEPIDNPSVAKVLLPGERQYLTTSSHCDCGTVLGPRGLETPEELEERLAKEASRLARKGWSEAKIARAIGDRRKAEARPDGGGVDSIELWVEVVRDLFDELGLPHVGLVVRSYRGAIATENFAATRRTSPRGAPLRDVLSSLNLDEVTILRRAG